MNNLLAGFTGYIEVSEGFNPRPDISHVLFDFDGTLSLIRQGWPEVMLNMFLEMFPRNNSEPEEVIRNMLWDDMMRLNGKQTIYQMIQFAERVKEFGGIPKDPLWYKKEYLRRLEVRIHDRIAGLESGKISPDSLLLYKARQILEALFQRGMHLYLASGTDIIYVRREARLLDIEKYFDDKIYGAIDDYKKFSKQIVIQRILSENKIDGTRLLAFGDGYVEIENTKAIGGLAVAVASDEANNGSGKVDEWKLNRLKSVGADIVIADYRDWDSLLKLIFTK